MPNPYRDPDNGRFTFAPGGASGAVASALGRAQKAKSRSLDVPPLAEEMWRPGNVGSTLTAEQQKAVDKKRNAKLSRERQDEALGVTMELYSSVSTIQEPLTAEIADIVGSAGGEMSGLAHRQKFPPSLFRKIQDEMVDKEGNDTGQSAADVGASMRDTVRYTAVYDAGETWEQGDSLRERVIASGGRVVKNPAGMQTGEGYRGRNMTFVKNGVEFELQVHSKESLEVKEVNHKIFEKMREGESPFGPGALQHDKSPAAEAYRQRLTLAMQENSDRGILIEEGMPVLEGNNKSPVWYTADRTSLQGVTIPPEARGLTEWDESFGPRLQKLEDIPVA